MLLLHSEYAKGTMMMRDCSEYNEWCRKIQKSRQYTRNNNNNNNTENETSEWAYQGIILFVQFLLCLGILLCAVFIIFCSFFIMITTSLSFSVVKFTSSVLTILIYCDFWGNFWLNVKNFLFMRTYSLLVWKMFDKSQKEPNSAVFTSLINWKLKRNNKQTIATLADGFTSHLLFTDAFISFIAQYKFVTIHYAFTFVYYCNSSEPILFSVALVLFFNHYTQLNPAIRLDSLNGTNKLKIGKHTQKLQ